MEKSLNDSLKELSEYTNSIKAMIEKSSLEETDFDELLKQYGVTSQELEDAMEFDMTPLDLKFKKLTTEAISPNYAHETDSGFDFYSTEEIEIPAFGRALMVFIRDKVLVKDRKTRGMTYIKA